MSDQAPAGSQEQEEYDIEIGEQDGSNKGAGEYRVDIHELPTQPPSSQPLAPPSAPSAHRPPQPPGLTREPEAPSQELPRPPPLPRQPLPLPPPLIAQPTPMFWESWDPNKEEFRWRGLPLYQAALHGDWAAAKLILQGRDTWIRHPITERGDIALHVAIANGHTHFVKKLVQLMRDEDLLTKNNFGDASFNLAAAYGVVDIAKLLVRRKPELPNITGYKSRLPLHAAVRAGHRGMTQYLLSITNFDELEDPGSYLIQILIASISSQMFDVAIHLLKRRSKLAVLRDADEQTALHALAMKPLKSETYYRNRLWRMISTLGIKFFQIKWYGLPLEDVVVQMLWEVIFRQEPNQISSLISSPWNVLFKAAENGNIRVLAPIISSYPDVVLRTNEHGHTIFHIAITNRQKEIFELIYEIGANKDWIAAQLDPKYNTMLHLVAIMASSLILINRVPGAALQMQMEIRWFKAVEAVVGPDLAEAENIENETPRMVFTKEHERLREAGEEWMKKTAESCTLVPALIATVAFAASFTPPGGTDNGSGNPILVNRPIFMAFAICNAISLFSSSSSILVFLFILTSRYEEDEFLSSLPLKLMLGLTLLFISIAAMMGAFTTAFFITFQKGVLCWLPIPIALLAVVPVTVFAWQQYPLLRDVYESTYGSRSVFKPRELELIKKN